MGLFLVNRGYLGPEPQSPVSPAYYSLLSAIGFFLVWGAYPATAGWKDWKTYLVAILRIAGVCLLGFLIWQYKTTDGKPFTTIFMQIGGRKKYGGPLFPAVPIFQ